MRIPQYPTGQIQKQGQPQQVRARVSPAAFGAGDAAAFQAAGSGLSRLAQTWERMEYTNAKSAVRQRLVDLDGAFKAKAKELRQDIESGKSREDIQSEISKIVETSRKGLSELALSVGGPSIQRAVQRGDYWLSQELEAQSEAWARETRLAEQEADIEKLARVGTDRDQIDELVQRVSSNASTRAEAIQSTAVAVEKALSNFVAMKDWGGAKKLVADYSSAFETVQREKLFRSIEKSRVIEEAWDGAVDKTSMSGVMDSLSSLETDDETRRIARQELRRRVNVERGIEQGIVEERKYNFLSWYSENPDATPDQIQERMEGLPADFRDGIFKDVREATDANVALQIAKDPDLQENMFRQWNKPAVQNILKKVSVGYRTELYEQWNKWKETKQTDLWDITNSAYRLAKPILDDRYDEENERLQVFNRFRRVFASYLHNNQQADPDFIKSRLGESGRTKLAKDVLSLLSEGSRDRYRYTDPKKSYELPGYEFEDNGVISDTFYDKFYQKTGVRYVEPFSGTKLYHYEYEPEDADKVEKIFTDLGRAGLFKREDGKMFFRYTGLLPEGVDRKPWYEADKVFLDHYGKPLYFEHAGYGLPF